MIDQLSAHTIDAVTDLRSRDYMRFLSCLVQEDGREHSAGMRFAARWPMAPNSDLVQKAAVAAGTTTDAGWASPLSPLRFLSDAFLSYSRPLSVIGRLPNLKMVPANVAVAQTTAPVISQWTGENLAKAVSAGSLATVSLTTAKISSIVVVTSELVALIAPGSELALRAELAASVAQFADAQFLDPAVAPVVGVHPGSITNGLTPIAPSGTTAASVVVDVDKLIGAFLTANPDTSNAVLLMTPSVASMLVSATKSQTLTINGGTYAGVPVVTSGSVGSRIVMLDPTAILVADNGIVIDASREATLQLDSVPDSPPVAGSLETSLWQTSLVGLRCERYITWKRSRTSAVALVSPAAYVAGS